MNHTSTTIAALRLALDSQQVSATELARAALSAAQANAQGRGNNAFLDIQPEHTLAQAAAADARLAAGERSPLLGIPLAHKDIFVTQGWATTAGSKMLAAYQSPFDATVVSQLKAAGMVNIGKLNCDEFAMGSANENSAYGAVLNPWDHTAVPGGSSGGSAAAVAAGIVPVATGTDTGGSVRQPAAFCGVTGIKPTYGRASRYGMIAYASSLDQAGVLAHTAQDCALVLSAMTGFDPQDATSVDKAAENYAAGLSAYSLKGKRIGVPKEFLADGVAHDVRAAVEAAIADMVRQGAVRVDVSLPRTALSIPAYYVIAPAEASSNLSRFDGVRYGYRAPQGDFTDLDSMYTATRAQGFGAEVQRRILTGAYVLSSGYYDAYYIQAQKLRRLIAQDFKAAFVQCDFIAGPVAPTVAWDLSTVAGRAKQDPNADYLADIFTLGASLAGLPGMSVPCGFGGAVAGAPPKRPVGLQLIGNYFDEAGLLGAAHAYQHISDWHTRTPC
jgi:aspartyl-tRNA(Asn)/glutamyl-tRNA(Gln) amidotransferase subunit A